MERRVRLSREYGIDQKRPDSYHDLNRLNRRPCG